MRSDSDRTCVCRRIFFYAGQIRRTTEEQARNILKDASARNTRMLEYEISNKLTLFQRIAAQYHKPFAGRSQQISRALEPLNGLREKSEKNNTKFLLDAARVLNDQKEKQAAILAVDINHFKMINELLGVEAGNEAICGLEKALLENSRSDEVVGHRLADQFMVLWLYGSREELTSRLEQLAEGLEELARSMGRIHFQSAIGVHEIRKTGTEPVNTTDVERICGS